MDNFERGDKALAALRAIGVDDPTGQLGEPWPRGYPLSDLLADMCHLARRIDVDLKEFSLRGLTHYAADVIEQAWEHSEDWHGHLQDPTNLNRARQVMQTAGVPEFVYDDALRYVGLLPPLPKDED